MDLKCEPCKITKALVILPRERVAIFSVHALFTTMIGGHCIQWILLKWILQRQDRLDEFLVHLKATCKNVLLLSLFSQLFPSLTAVQKLCKLNVSFCVNVIGKSNEIVTDYNVLLATCC